MLLVALVALSVTGALTLSDVMPKYLKYRTDVETKRLQAQVEIQKEQRKMLEAPMPGDKE